MSQEITTERVKELRDQTGISVMQCKKALEEAMGDMEKALMILKKKSSEVAAKKGDRTAEDGLVTVKTDGKKASVVILSCETDFVAKNESFVEGTHKIAEIALKDGLDKAKEEASSIVPELVQKIGEKIELVDLEIVEGNTIGTYIHHDGKSGTIVVLEGGDEALAKDIAMHITAMKPEYTSREEVDSSMIEKVKEMFKEEVASSGKPEDIQQKMLEGKINSYLGELTLLDQSFFKDPNITIGNLLSQKGAKIEKFIRKSVR